MRILIFVYTLMLLCMQYAAAFLVDSGEGGSVEFAWFAVWKSWSPDIKVSFVISLLFPIYYYVVLASRYKTFGMDDVFAGCIFLCGVLEYGMLAETGERRYHGNFAWGLQLAVFLVWFVSVKKFCRFNRDYNVDGKWERRKVLAGWIILLMQGFSGIYYIAQLLCIEGKWY